MTISIEGAAQLARPARGGLPFLRHDRAGELELEPGSITLDGELIAGFEADRGAPVRIDARGCAVVPGLVDCHTHLPFAGWRAEEYERKVTGVPYEQIAASGGGIRASAAALARADDADVLDQAGALATEMLAHGTTSFECKSGYGLSVAAELRSLALARELGERVTQRTRSTALVAHAVPDGWDADGWLDAIGTVAGEIAAAGASAVDIYVETVAFANGHLRRVGELARRTGLDLRVHAEQFSSSGSVAVALEEGARSVDHLACLPAEHVEPLAAAECAAVLLPGAELLGAERVAPARRLADAGAICVLASDLNPGTSPIASLPLVIGIAVRRYGWNAREALLATTLNAAWVLRMSEVTGSLEAGKRADVVVLDGPLEHVPYRFGHDPVACVIAGGELVRVRPDCAWRVTR